jgi:hypothetical protein
MNYKVTLIMDLLRRIPGKAAYTDETGSACGFRTGGVRPRSICWIKKTQYWSALNTSPPLRLPSAHQVDAATESLTNRTEPSVKHTLTPAGWLLLAVDMPQVPPQRPPGSLGFKQVSLLGVL